jgi:hypothetical protein
MLAQRLLLLLRVIDGGFSLVEEKRVKDPFSGFQVTGGGLTLP